MRIIGIDTGNSNMKTPNYVFPSGLTHYGNNPPPIKGETIYFDGEYYSLSAVPLPYMYDKSENDDFFILSLIAIAKELMNDYPDQMEIMEKVVLAVGLPPTHLPTLQERYADYFRRNGEPIHFSFNDVKFVITISRVLVYPQSYAAVYKHLDRIKLEPECFLIDIGGWTTDVIQLHYGQYRAGQCHSYEMGAIRMKQEIKRVLSERLNLSPSDFIIESMLNGKMVLGPEASEIAEDIAADYARALLQELSNAGVDLKTSYGFFLGGGASLMKRDIQKIPNLRISFLDDIRENAIGYEKLAELQLRGS